ncbi:efflux RND transporter periplasmic adaptor subunit [Sphingomonas aurantiaca]|jgi:RND family efflux transporter MFP subunit|uniref:RND family efflux transporter MFP subunit n=1 Tax=Sphingomonas aurantiaca TaxID=185949 RepID=A0A2T5GSV7_9SPHN|nr:MULTISPECIES: efflux RND transporter periplasmic adaptor subunit [Sphingomonas]KQN15982.1 secretion protein HylD [Sphingomonas sp. Leaf28]PTQ62391.1 RND family efflux transporter MFP subunit [Sphingomonas aurantiaca]
MNYETKMVGSDSDEQLALPDYSAPSHRRRNIIIAVILVLAIVAAVYAFKSGKKDAAAASPNAQLPSVTVVVPGRQMVDRTISATGTLAARREMPVGVAGEGGMITRVLVEPGTWVAAGQVLATVDRSVQTETAASLAASVTVARSDETIAQAELDRAKQLVDRGFISKADLQRKAATRDAAAARVKVAQATLGEARARNGRLDIRAPAAGLVLTRGVEPGQIVGPSAGVLFRMAMGGQMEMRAQLSEADLAGLRAGARATVVPVGTTQGYPGEVWQVSPVIDPQTRQGIARIAVKYDPALRPGGFAAATIVGGVTQAPLLPDSALQSDEKGNYVYIVGPGDKIARRNVTIGQVSDAGVTIAGGLDGSERVVQSAGGFLAPGQTVKPITKKAS